MRQESSDRGQETDVAAAQELDFEGADRVLPPTMAKLMVLMSFGYALFHLAVLNFFAIDEWVYRVLHVNLGAFIAMLTLKSTRHERRNSIPVYDWLLAIAALGCSAYIMWQLDELLARTGVITTTGDFLCGLIGTIIVVEFARRLSGLILPVIALVFITYVFAGPWLPGVLHHSGFQLPDVFSFLYSQDGIFGLTVAASSRYIILFVAFAVFLNACGTGSYFMKLAMSLVGWSRGGPAKVSVISGLMFGTVSGSAVANVVASGTFTIPMMLKAGYPRDSAGAVEASSSSGGQLAPPVMGAGAFIMAEITGIPYSEIVVAAILPCILFYAAVFFSVDRQAARLQIHGIPRAELPPLRGLLGEIMLLLPLYVLLYLLVSGYSIIAAGTWGVASTLLVLLCNTLGLSSRWLALPLILYVALPATGMAVNSAGLIATLSGALVVFSIGVYKRGGSQVAHACRVLLETSARGLAETARNSLQLIAVMACAGIIVGVLGLTGLGGRLSAIILSAAGDSQPIAFVLAMLISIVLGMGMPTTAAYAIAAAVVAPALQGLGVSPLAAHMFVFYCAVISAITPPVAIASFAAAAISRGDPWRTSIESIRIGAAAFILPFMFYLSPEILMDGSVAAISWVTISALLSVIALAIGIHAELYGRLSPLERTLFVVASLLLLHGSAAAVLLGAVLGAALYAWRIKRYKPAPQAG